jgi:hypothetical protein
MEPLLVCFDRSIRDKILIKPFKDKKLKEYVLPECSIFTEAQCKLVNNQPLSPDDQDDLVESLLTMEDKEIRFWDSVNETPHLMNTAEWTVLLADYKEREAIKRRDSINNEIHSIINFCKQMEVKTLNNIEQYGDIPKEILSIAHLNPDTRKFVSNKWGVNLLDLSVLFDYRDESELRHLFYTSSVKFLTKDTKKVNYDYWVDFINLITDARFDYLDNFKVLEYWVNTSIELSYDNFMLLTSDEIYQLWIDCIGLLNLSANNITVQDTLIYNPPVSESFDAEWGF